MKRRSNARAPKPSKCETPESCRTVQGLVIPGGESTTMLKLLDATGLKEPLRQFAESKPIFGTCAGAILVGEAGDESGPGVAGADGYRGRA